MLTDNNSGQSDPYVSFLLSQATQILETPAHIANPLFAIKRVCNVGWCFNDL